MYLVRGEHDVGAYNINNNAVIVVKAIINYLLNGEPIEKTIRNCTDVKEFQTIIKTGSTYNYTMQLINDKEEVIQKVNRIYAGKDKTRGLIYKVKVNKEGERQLTKIGELPPYPIVDNDNQIIKSVSQLDIDFYIDLAKKRVKSFISEGKDKNMANTKEEKKTELNIYHKLNIARKMLLDSQIKKTGKNIALEFTYFTLDDIVPHIIKIFNELGIIHKITINEKVATITIINCDNDKEVIEFALPFIPITPIITNTGKKATNEMQALGSSITYIRRYLYLIALDICEEDTIDKNLEKEDDTPLLNTHNTIFNQLERTQIKKELTDADGRATDLQINALKEKLKELRNIAAEDNFIQNIAIQTNGFTELSKKDFEKYMLETNEKIKEVREND